MLEEAVGNIYDEKTEILGKLRVNHRKEERDETNSDAQHIFKW